MALAGLLAAGAAGGSEPAAPASAAAPVPQFTDAAPQLGLDFVSGCGRKDKRHLLESVGNAGGLLDVDRDGDLDVFLTSGWRLDEEGRPIERPGQRLYLNRLSETGSLAFVDRTSESGLGTEAWTLGLTAGDFDGDGDTDLYVLSFGTSVLYRNELKPGGRLSFRPVAAPAGPAFEGWPGSAAFFDPDADGDLDLFVSGYVASRLEDVPAAKGTTVWRDTLRVMDGPFGLPGQTDAYWRNLLAETGTAAFRDETEAAGLADVGHFFGLGVLPFDADGDGDTDLYVANDSNANYLYRNEGLTAGRLRFKEVGVVSGAAFNEAGMAQAGMGVALGDADADGDPDLFVTNFAFDTNTLYLNEGRMFFNDRTAAARLAEPSYRWLSWGTGFLDADHDGDLDLAVASGHIYPQVDGVPSLGESYAQPNQLYLSRLVPSGVLQFDEVSERAGPGFSVLRSSRGLAQGDVDNDGDVDLLILNVDAPPMLLLNGTVSAGAVPPQAHWLEVQLSGRPPNTGAFGAVVRVRAAGRTLLRPLHAGGSYGSHSDQRLHFGLGPARSVEALEVRWPDGTRTEAKDVAADRIVAFTQPAASAGSAPR